MSKNRNARKRKTCKCGKQEHRSKEDARNQRCFLGEQGRSINAITYYKCKYGSWHWTSSVYGKDGRHIASIQEVLDQYVAQKKAEEQRTA